MDSSRDLKLNLSLEFSYVQFAFGKWSNNRNADASKGASLSIRHSNPHLLGANSRRSGLA